MPGGVLDEHAVAVRILRAQDFAIRRADADGENAQARLLALARRRYGRVRVVVVLAVGEEHENLVVLSLLLKRGARGLNRLGQRGAALGNHVYVEEIHALPERFLIERKRALQKRAAGERDQPEAVALRETHQIDRRELRARQAVRLHVIGQHAFRGVDGHHDVETALFGFLKREAQLRREREKNQRRDCDGQQQPAGISVAVSTRRT